MLKNTCISLRAVIICFRLHSIVPRNNTFIFGQLTEINGLPTCFSSTTHTDSSHIRPELNEFNNRVFECRRKIDFNLKHLLLSSAFSVNKIIVSIDIQCDNVTRSYARQEVLSEPGRLTRNRQWAHKRSGEYALCIRYVQYLISSR